MMHSLTNSRHSLDHLVSAGEQRARDFEAKRPRTAEVDHKLELGRLENWEVRWLSALENAPRIDSDLAKGLEDIGSVAYQAAGFGIGARRVNGWKPDTRRQHGKLNAPCVEK